MALNSLTLNNSVTTSWNANISGFGGPITNANALANGTNFLTGTSGSQGQQLYSQPLLLAASGGSQTINLSLISGNVVGQNTNFQSVKLFNISLPASGSTNGTGCSGVLIGGAASNPMKGFLVSGGCLVVGNGGNYNYADSTFNGFSVTSGVSDQLKFTNLDSANSGYLVVTIAGN